MKSAPLLALLGAGLLFAWMAPDGAEPEAAPAPAGAASVENDPWPAEEVVLPRADDGHFYADVTVDGAPSRMLVDTGASVIALTGADARAMGIAWNAEDVGPVGQGAGGAVHGVPVMLSLVQVGDLEARNVRAVVIPDGLRTSLLGQSFLSTIERVEIGQQQMILGG